MTDITDYGFTEQLDPCCMGAQKERVISHLHRCVIVMGDGQVGPMFRVYPDGDMSVHLTEYAIIPLSEYNRLKKPVSWWKRILKGLCQ